jgi:hypothetical protein
MSLRGWLCIHPSYSNHRYLLFLYWGSWTQGTISRCYWHHEKLLTRDRGLDTRVVERLLEADLDDLETLCARFEKLVRKISQEIVLSCIADVIRYMRKMRHKAPMCVWCSRRRSTLLLVTRDWAAFSNLWSHVLECREIVCEGWKT